MAGFANPFARGDDGGLFDDYDEFVPDTIPQPGPFLAGLSVLTGDDHLAFHRLTRELFEERGVYDMTFNYNLARLNLDTRHSDAGYRYARERLDAAAFVDAAGESSEADDSHRLDDSFPAGDLSVLRAEFTPTTPFCPQCHTLAIGSFRAWNGLADRHEYDLVRVRAHPMHHKSESINEELAAMEAAYLETGDASVRVEAGDAAGGDGAAPGDAAMDGMYDQPTDRPQDVDAPF
ncbi:hypothetical protein Halru_2994 [Halovivax ruber XH-70]|uniref:DUF7998 domain-containing protein n=1 Tax=Halovivax ruber (strain DSM 18193 / JCM 13892 / XH-70) TaxID=797302 RepID=L0IH40_HALRX|nr:hypothetical protein [Halovivax ruber]AGB17561.1 hypothetical protein Halru_2994 [Halovivax ruber XH-70]